MRRRPSGSGEDDDGPASSAVHVPVPVLVPVPVAAIAVPSAAHRTSPANTREMTRAHDTSRPPRPTWRAQDRRVAADASTPRLPDQRVSWPALSPSPRSALDETATRRDGDAALPPPQPQSPPSPPPPPPPPPPRRYSADRTHPSSLRSRRNPWRCSALTLTTAAAALILLATIIHSFLTRQLDPKGCAMSYMMPAFARFSDFDTEHTRFASKYSLYLYREGGVDEDTRVKGIPVLFVPGNAGSYKQMRPIAAEAAHHFHDVLRSDPAALDAGKRPLDFFTVDFNEELTAFHGQTLLDQAEYLNEAIAYILALYHSPHRSLREPGLPEPKSVIILGHSMGGVVARTMLRMPNYQEHSINTIITLSAPHARPPISFDADMAAAYHDVNTFWRRSYSADSPAENRLADVTLVSVAGGGLDTMIASEYSSLTSLVPDTHGFTVFTSSIPNVWTGMDHLAIMWCDQFRKALVKAIFDIVDGRRSSQTRAQPERIAALRKRLLTGMESVVRKADLEDEPTVLLTLDPGTTNIMPQGERLVLRSLGENTRAHVMPIPTARAVDDGGKFTLLTDLPLDAGNDSSTVAVYLCGGSAPPSGAPILPFTLAHGPAGSKGLTCKNAARDVSLLPASTKESRNAFESARPFSYLQYDLSDLGGAQFIAVVEKGTMPSGWLIAEFSASADSSIAVGMGHHQLLLNGLRLRLPAARPMMTELKIPEIHSTMFAYNLELSRPGCGDPEESFAPLLRQYIQEPYESKYFVNTRGGRISVHGISPYMPPPLSGGGASEGLSLQLWTDPTCDSPVDVSLNVDVLGSAGRLVMRYRTVFAAFPVLVVAIVLRKQFKVYDASGDFMSFSQSMDLCLRTSLPTIFTALTFLAVALSKASKGPWTRSWLGSSTGVNENDVDFAFNDVLLGTSDPFFWFLVPLFGFLSVGICTAVNYAVMFVTHTFAIVSAVITSWIQRVDDTRATQPTFTARNRHQRILTTGVLLLLIVTFIPYQFAYVVLCLVHIATCVRAVRVARESHSSQSHNFSNYTHAILVLLVFILPINIPTLVVWVHNLAVQWLSPFSTHHNLLAILPFILLIETMSSGNMIPRLTSRAHVLTNVFIFVIAVYAAVFGVSYAYRLHYLVNAMCAWLFLIHLSSSSSSSTRPPVPPARRLSLVFAPSEKGPGSGTTEGKVNENSNGRVKKTP